MHAAAHGLSAFSVPVQLQTALAVLASLWRNRLERGQETCPMSDLSDAIKALETDAQYLRDNLPVSTTLPPPINNIRGPSVGQNTSHLRAQRQTSVT
jgi:hypothetical protein